MQRLENSTDWRASKHWRAKVRQYDSITAEGKRALAAAKEEIDVLVAEVVEGRTNFIAAWRSSTQREESQ
jgi:DNA-binding PadR family transcriptional regulator